MRLVAPLVASEGRNKVPVAITFRNYITPETLRAWTENLDLGAGWTEVRYTTEAGHKGTLHFEAGAADWYRPSQERIDEAVGSLRNSGKFKSLQGIYFVKTEVSVQILPYLASNPDVFVVDVMPIHVRNEIIRNGGPNLDWQAISVEPYSPFSDMEDFGLENFAP